MSKLQENGRVLGQREVAQQTYLLRIRAPQIARLARPGQFVMLQVREGSDPLLRRPLSFHRVFPEVGDIEILYRVVGRGTWLLSRCSPETALNLIGPLGNGFRIFPEQDAPILLIAGGIGIAPLFELITHLAGIGASTAKESIQLFYGARTAAEMLPAEAFSGMNVTVHASTDDGSLGYHGYVTDLFQEIVRMERLGPRLLYSCGPLAMQYHVARWAITHNVPSQLSLEALMACGVGACLGCALPARNPESPLEDNYVHVCKDGPIFEAGSIQWHKIHTQQMCPPTFPFS